MSGNCATGICRRASRPASVMTIETTNASRGRSMKTLEIMTSAVGRRRGQYGLLNDLSRPYLLDAVHDHLVAFLDARQHHDVGADVRTGLQPACLDLVLAVDHQSIVAGLVDLQGCLRNHQARLLPALADDGGDDLAIGQPSIGIGN